MLQMLANATVLSERTTISVILTLITIVTSITIIVIVAKSNNNQFKTVSPQQKAEQRIIIFKFIIASVLFLLANVVRLLGLVMYLLNYYTYTVFITRALPDTFIIAGISLVFWPFRLVPKCCYLQKQSSNKVTLFIQQVVEAHDMIDEFDQLSTSSTPSNDSA